MIGLGCTTCEVASKRGRVAISFMASLLLFSHTAYGHFILQAPASWMSQDSLGAPQKLGPCGDEGGGTPTGAVTTFAPGETITVSVKEVVFHPGHYRVALAVNSRDELPAEPIVTAGTTPCGSVPIDPTPAFPVLVDGALQHNSAFSGSQSIKVTLPSDVTCTHCTLQVIEFMSNHGLNDPGGCFYHHCADIAIKASGSGPPGTGGTTSFGGTTSSNSSGGAMLATGGRSASPSGGRSAATGGLATGGQRETAGGGVPATGGLQALAGGQSTLGLSGASTGSASGTLTQTATGGTNALATGGSVAIRGSGGSLQSANSALTSGGTPAATTPLGTSGIAVGGMGAATDVPGATGCACSLPGEARRSWLSPLSVLLASIMLLRVRRKARPVWRTVRRLQRAARVCPAPRCGPFA